MQKIIRGLQNKPKQPKVIGPEYNPVIACSLCNITSISHISLVSTPNYDPFEALDSRIPKLENHMWCAQET